MSEDIFLNEQRKQSPHRINRFALPKDRNLKTKLAVAISVVFMSQSALAVSAFPAQTYTSLSQYKTLFPDTTQAVTCKDNSCTISGSFSGPALNHNLYAGTSSSSLTLENGSVDIGGMFAAGLSLQADSDAAANSNTLALSNLTVKKNIGEDPEDAYELTFATGAIAINESMTATATASNNMLSIQNTVASNTTMMIGAYAHGKDAVSSNNTVIVDNVQFNAASGSSGILGVGCIASESVTVENNSVFLGSISVTSDDPFMAALVDLSTPLYAMAAAPSPSKVTLVNNSMYVYGQSDLSKAGLLLGLIDMDSIETKNISGNTLYFGYNSPWTSTGNYHVLLAGLFDEINLRNVVWGKTITIDHLYPSLNLSPVAVNATEVAFSGVDFLHPGDSYNMLKVSYDEDLPATIALTSGSSTFTIGTAIEGKGEVSLLDADGDGTNDTVNYKVLECHTKGATAQTHNVAMTSSAAASALTQGGDTTSAAGFNLATSGVSGVQAFSAVGGGAARVETGSHVNMASLNFSVGIGDNHDTAYGTLSTGAAFEAGYGRFKNHFDAGAADPFIKKSGHVSYYGAAILSNLTFTNLWHVNAAFRLGKIKSSQDDALYDAGTKLKYDASISTYYLGAELGLGRIIKLDDRNSIDLYGKYFFLYQDKDSFMAGEDRYELDAVKSHRLRLAGRYTHDFTAQTALYTGLGVEHEFDGKAQLNINTSYGRLKAEPAKMDGTRAFAELGVTIKPQAKSGFSLDLGIKGLYGSGSRGGWVNAEVKYSF